MKRNPLDLNLDGRKFQRRCGRNFSTTREFLEIIDDAPPKYRFASKTVRAHAAWRRALLAKVRAALGRSVPSVPLRPKIISQKDGGDHIHQMVVYDTTPGISVPAHVLIPKIAWKTGRKVPAVLCIHGHGYGSRDLVGDWPKDDPRIGWDYATQMVRRGMVGLAPDMRGFGLRAVDEDGLGAVLRKRRLPEYKWFKRDSCDRQNLKASLLGFTFMGLQQHDLRCGLDYLISRPEVDRARLGACGLSTGGMQSLFLAATDERVRACIVSGTLTSYRSYAFEVETVCGAQVPFGVYQYGDLADVACLIAPRGFSAENGTADWGFQHKVAQREFRRIAGCYKLLGVPEECKYVAFRDGHTWNGKETIPWMEGRLRA